MFFFFLINYCTYVIYPITVYHNVCFDTDQDPDAFKTFPAIKLYRKLENVAGLSEICTP